MQFVSRVLLAGLAVSLAAGTLLRPRPRLGPRPGTPRLEDDALVTADAERLPLARWLPRGKPRAVVLGLHGFGDYRQAFGLAGPRLARQRIALYAYDQRGFGETRTRGRWPGAETLIHDLADALVALRERHPDLPVILLGESMGGSVALAGLGRGIVRGAAGAILVAPGVRGNMPMRQLHDVALRLAVLALPWLAVELRRGGRPWLEPGEARRLADDPHILRELSVGTYDGLVELATLASEVPRTPLPPILILHGALDMTIPQRAIDELLPRLGSGVERRDYAHGHHLLLHEHIVDEVLEECRAWIDRIVATTPKTPSAAGA